MNSTINHPLPLRSLRGSLAVFHRISRASLWTRLMWGVLTGSMVLFLPWTAQAAEPASNLDLETAFERLPRLEYGQEQEPLVPIDEAVVASHTDPDLRQELEEKLIHVLQSDATNAAKDFACRSLSLIGSEKAVPSLAALLHDPELASLARFALERIPGAAVERAFREALSKLEGELKIGVISSMAFREDPEAVDPLAALLEGSDAAVARAAALALARIGTPEAAQILRRFRADAPDDRQLAALQASVQVAENLLQQGDRRRAARIFNQLRRLSPDDPSAEWLRQAAFRGWVAARPQRATSELLDALKSGDSSLRNLAARLITDWPDESTPQAFIDALPNLPAAGQVALLRAISDRADTQAHRPVRALLTSSEPSVRVAAVESLAKIGRSSDVLPLARIAAKGTPEERDAARKTLTGLQIPDVTDSLVAALKEGEPPVQAELLRTLQERRASESAPALEAFVGDADSAVARAALQALAVLGDAAQVPALLERLSHAGTPSQREQLGQALESISERAGSQATEPVLRRLRAADVEEQPILLRILGAIGDAPSLEAVRRASNQGPQEVRSAAFRALANWPNPDAAPDLLRTIRTTDNPTHRVLAFRGYVRLAQASDASPADKTEMLTEALDLARTDDETRLALGALGEVPTLEALQRVASLLDRPAVVDEAGASAVRIASKLEPQHRDEAARIVQRVIESAGSDAVVREARKQLRALKNR